MGFLRNGDNVKSGSIISFESSQDDSVVVLGNVNVPCNKQGKPLDEDFPFLFWLIGRRKSRKWPDRHQISSAKIIDLLRLAMAMPNSSTVPRDVFWGGGATIFFTESQFGLQSIPASPSMNGFCHGSIVKLRMQDDEEGVYIPALLLGPSARSQSRA